ncbi:MAG: hypothetical protein V3W01_02275 [Dehalococcoidales bacterium]
MAEPALDRERQEKAKKYARARRYLSYADLALAGNLPGQLLWDHPSYQRRVEHAGYYKTHKPNQ